MIATLLSLTLYIVGARMNTELQLIVCQLDWKRVYTLLVITMST